MRVMRVLTAGLLALMLAMQAPGGLRAQDMSGPVPGHGYGAVPESALSGAARNAAAQRMVAAYRDWVARWQIPNAALVVMAGDRVMGRAEFGSYRVAQPVPLASLSKAVTAVCIARLVDEGLVTFDTPLSGPLRRYLRLNPPWDSRVHQITLGQLLTHSSGLTYDPTQGQFPPGVHPTRPSVVLLARAGLAAWLESAPGTAYSYNNINYLLLGMVIESVTGQPYLAACRQRVLAPLGITRAGFTPAWRVLGAFGGWQMSVRDYARFLAYYDPARGLIGTPQSAWPRFDLGGGAYYSLGAAMRLASPQTNFFHSGSWNGRWGTTVTSYSSRFVTMGTVMRYVTAEAPSVSNAARQDLDSAMWAALYPRAAMVDELP